MGVVYRARQIAINRVVALKMLLHGRFSEAAFVQRFRLEAEAAAHLDHPNIVPIYEVGQQQGQPYYSMKLIEGRSLDQVSAECGMRSAEFKRSDVEWLRRSAALMVTVARAVHYAHQHGVLHRDIKPHNILVDAQGQPHLTDFGLAKLLDQDSGLTVSAAVIGSPGFMAPEQAAGKTRQVTTAADVYGLGAVLYVLLTGKPVFQADTPLETVRRVIEQEPARPRLLNPAVDRDLETICLKCLQKEPAKRYASAQALAEDLECWLRAEPIQARRPSQVERVWLWCRRQPVRAGLIGALVVTFVLGLSGVLWQWSLARAGELRARQNAYAADMMVAQAALEKGDLSRALEALNRQRPLPGQKDLRGWEWRYFWQQCKSDQSSVLCKYASGTGALVFSRDGKWLAIRTGSGSVALWDVVSRTSVAELRGSTSDNALALSPAGDLLAYGSMETNSAPVTTVYGIAERREFARFPNSAPLAHCSFSPDGGLLATLAQDGRVTLRQMRPSQLLTNFLTTRPEPYHGRILFSPNGKFLAIAHSQGILLWEWASGYQQEIPALGIGDAITGMAFSPDGTLLGAACRRIQIWAVDKLGGRSHDSEVPMVGQSDPVLPWIHDLAFAPDGKTLATAGADAKVRIWDVKTLTEIRRFRNTQQVWNVAFSPDGKELLGSAADGSVHCFDLASESLSFSPAVLPIPVWAGAFALAPDSKHFIALDKRDGAASLWSIVPKLEPLERLSFLGTNNQTIRWAPDGRTLAVGDMSGNVRIWDYATRRVITNFANPGTKVGTLKFQGGGRTLLYGFYLLNSYRRLGKLWDTRTWAEIHLPPDWPTDKLSWGAVSSDNRTLAALDTDGTVTWWEMASGHRLARKEHYFASNDGYLMFSPVGPLLAGSATDGSTTIWDVRTGRIIASIRANFQAVHGVAFSPDGQRLLSGGEDPSDVVRLLDMGSQRHVATLAGPPDRVDQFWSLEMSADLNTIVAVGIDKTALLWRAPSWAEIEAEEKRQAAREALQK
jgi:WD40 repeat protein/tRNA A-37 threonylcarbamoyl transferase component Bud32